MNVTYTPDDLARVARVYVVEQVEWLAPALYAAPILLTRELPAPAAIDHYGRIYLNPDWLARLQGEPVPQVGFLLVHEVWHWLREHALRAEEINAQPLLWNIACDLEINDYVPRGLQMPDFGAGPAGATPQQYGLPEGQLAEWYYWELADSTGDRSTDRDALATENVWDEGSGVHGKPRPWELPADSPDAHTLSDLDRQSLREEVARRILEAQKTRGNMPTGWTRWAQEVMKPRVNWREQLKRVVRSAINEEFRQRIDCSYRRLHRRAEIHKPFIMLALQGEYRPCATAIH